MFPPSYRRSLSLLRDTNSTFYSPSSSSSSSSQIFHCLPVSLVAISPFPLFPPLTTVFGVAERAFPACRIAKNNTGGISSLLQNKNALDTSSPPSPKHPSSSTFPTATRTSRHRNPQRNHHQHRTINTLTIPHISHISPTSITMAGGKGKSGGKSSGGKTGADGAKKQQSHSSKAGLQVSRSPF